MKPRAKGGVERVPHRERMWTVERSLLGESMHCGRTACALRATFRLHPPEEPIPRHAHSKRPYN